MKFSMQEMDRPKFEPDRLFHLQRLARFLSLPTMLVWMTTLGYVYIMGGHRVLFAVGQGGIAVAVYERPLDSDFFLRAPARSVRWWFDISTRKAEVPGNSRTAIFVPLWPAILVFLFSWMLLRRIRQASGALPANGADSHKQNRLQISSVALCLGSLAVLMGAVGHLQEYLDPQRFYSRVEKPWLYFPSASYRILPSLEIAVARGKFSVSYKHESDYGWSSTTACSTSIMGISLCSVSRTTPLTSILSPDLFDPPNNLRASINAGRPGIIGWTIKISLLMWAGAMVAGILLVRARRTLKRRRRRISGLCLECGYDLRGSLERCPECGADFPN